MSKARVTVCEKPQGEITILYKCNPLKYSIFHKQQRLAEVVASKEIDAHLKNNQKPYKPASDHPWRNYGRHLNGKPINQPSTNATD